MYKDNLKKVYSAPQMEAVVLESDYTLLSGSETYDASFNQTGVDMTGGDLDD